MSYKILIINPGSTSTKIGVFEDETLQNDNKYLFVSDSAKHCCIVEDHEAEYENLTQRALTGELFD